MSRWRALLGLVAISLLNVSIAGAQIQPGIATDQTPLTLDQLEAMALANNPTIRQATAGVEAARAHARQAGTLPNPTVGYSAAEVSGGPVIRGGEHGFFVEQTIPLGGKLRLGRQTFERAADQAQALADLQQQRIRSAVRILYYEALTMERRVQVQDRLAQLASEAVSISAQLFNVGAADRPDVLESEIEAKRAQIELLATRNHQFAVWRRLAAMAGQPALTPRPLAGSIDAAIPELDRASALRDAAERSPEVRAARADVERNRALVAQARKVTSPDFFLRGGGAYNRELLETSTGGTPQAVGWEASLEAGVSVPLFNRNLGGVAAARADQSRAEAELGRLELSLESRLADTFDQYLTAVRTSEVYRDDVLPRAEEAYQLYLARYRGMAAAYPQVLIAQRTLFQMNNAYLESLETAWRAALRIQGFLIEDDGLVPPQMVGQGGLQ